LIVLLEDSPTDVFLVREAIAAHGLDVDLAIMEDGEKAATFLARIDTDEDAECPSLFLLDLNLPKTGGLEVLSRVRRSRRCANVPVVIMTSSDAEQDRGASAVLGATAYFRKPSGYEAFLKIGEVIHQLLARMN
jgi:DNA-binding response OmpR family regulator